MKIVTVDDYSEMSKFAAKIVASQVILKDNSVLGLATGDTPLQMYRELINLYNEEELDFSKITTFNLDEYYGISEDNPHSYHYYMKNNFFKFINIADSNINILDGKTKNIEDECKAYDNKIAAAGGIDLQVLGIGVNGHIGFNEPDVNFEAETHLVKLDKKTVESNARFFASKEDVPISALSMGIKTIMQSRKILLLASGPKKAEAVFKMLKEKISPELPASILQLHNDTTVIVDKAASSML
ncbi:glucosamine-6-phosphate deaminase [Clostridium felsineum]|uniref:glucosamine-6-phosphate deaminase n=1 Tax=Clostridium felsineum TaxID=36839 RepID=UPI00098C4DBB|nr:glucosamine-6-phosphate deaminase [Clostridium felsineum]URZ18351.1 Glucosamine-6-phosphate deaminase 1 [Clostridium felsineum DSM 794]